MLTLPEKVGLLRDAATLSEAGQMPESQALALVPLFAKEENRHVVAATAAIAGSINDHLVPEDLRGNYARFVRAMFAERARALSWNGKPGEDEDTQLLPGAAAPRCFRRVDGEGPGAAPGGAGGSRSPGSMTVRRSVPKQSARCSGSPPRTETGRCSTDSAPKPGRPRTAATGPALECPGTLPRPGNRPGSARDSPDRRIRHSPVDRHLLGGAFRAADPASRPGTSSRRTSTRCSHGCRASTEAAFRGQAAPSATPLPVPMWSLLPQQRREADRRAARHSRRP